MPRSYCANNQYCARAGRCGDGAGVRSHAKTDKDAARVYLNERIHTSAVCSGLAVQRATVRCRAGIGQTSTPPKQRSPGYAGTILAIAVDGVGLCMDAASVDKAAFCGLLPNWRPTVPVLDQGFWGCADLLTNIRNPYMYVLCAEHCFNKTCAVCRAQPSMAWLRLFLLVVAFSASIVAMCHVLIPRLILFVRPFIDSRQSGISPRHGAPRIR